MKTMRPIRETTVVAGAMGCRKAGCIRLGNHARGLCEPCYKATQQYVKDGVTTWTKLERQGKVLQPKATLKEWLLS